MRPRKLTAASGVSGGGTSCIRETRSADNTCWPFDNKNPKCCTSCSHSSCVSARSNRPSTHWIRAQPGGGAKLTNVALPTAENAAGTGMLKNADVRWTTVKKCVCGGNLHQWRQNTKICLWTQSIQRSEVSAAESEKEPSLSTFHAVREDVREELSPNWLR